MAIRELIFEGHPNPESLIKRIWPADEKTARLAALRLRISAIRKRSLPVIKRVWEDRLESTLPAEEQQFYAALREKFSTWQQVERATYPWRKPPRKSNVKDELGQAVNGAAATVSFPIPTNNSPADTAPPSTTVPLLGLMSREHAAVLRAAFLHNMGVTLNPDTLAVRTGLTIGAVRPALNGALRGLEEALHAAENGSRLSLDAEEIVKAVKKRWPRHSVVKIMEKIEELRRR